MTGHVSRRSVLRAVGVASGVGVLGTSSVSGAQADGYVVGTASRAADRAVSDRADSVRRTLDFGDVGRAVSGQFSAEALDALRNRPDVRYVEPDGAVELLEQSLPWGVDRIDADVAHADGATGAGADVAIIDSGIDPDHPDLQANLGTGYAVESCTDCATPWGDDNSHGTHCAGIAAAVDNAEGVVGVSTEATLHAVKVIGSDGYASVSGLAEGLQWVADQGFDVGSMSLGAASSYATLRDACQYAADSGVFLVAAAGNDGPCSDCVNYPAAYPTVVAVSATSTGDDLASYSSTGPEIDLAAPGSYVESTVPGGYAFKSGTSMATPHVAGAAAQLLANGYSSTEARDRLAATAEDIGLSSEAQGAGLVDVEAAVGDTGGDTGGDTDPAVTTGGAMNVGETTVTLEGSLDDLGGATEASVYFHHREQGASTWQETSAQTVSTTGAYSTNLSGLTAGTDYEFRAVADASDGDRATGTTLAYTTQSADTDVAVSTDVPETVGETAATLDGTLDDLGGAADATVQFEWGQSGGDLPNATATETLSSTGGFTASIDGLTAGTEYAYRAVAEAADGDTDAGAERTFTTNANGGDTAPVIDSFSVTEAGSPNPHAEITADWRVSDADGDLDTVVVRVVDSSGTVVDTLRSDVGGESASGTAQTKLKHRDGETFAVRVTVVDDAENRDSQSETVSS